MKKEEEETEESTAKNPNPTTDRTYPLETSLQFLLNLFPS